MRGLKLVLILLLLLAGVAIIFNFVVKKPANKNTNPPSPAEKIFPQTSSEGTITIKVNPNGLFTKAETWDFGIVLDTHTDELDQDLVKNTVMIDDQGRKFSPVSWEGDPPGGHHREGTLKFKAISPKPKFIQLKISQVGNVEERVFKWELK